MRLEELGFTSHFLDQLDPQDSPGLTPARVSRQDVNRYLVMDESGQFTAILPGKARTDITSRAQLPTVGDWVVIDKANDPALVVRMLDRASKFSRRESGDVVDEQVVAANIDVVFIVSGLDHNFNARRIERYLLLAQNNGASPVLVLNKADLCDNIQACISELVTIAGSTPIHITSALDSSTVEQLRSYLGPGRTGALLGSSGVGKSTLINALLGREELKTGDVRSTDSKGRHTTTHRELCVLEDGGLIIDTPGMREIQLWTDEQTVSESFPEIETYGQNCKFTDCKHESEPGCAVLVGVR